MKVTLKGGERNSEMEKFFMDNIFPVLTFGIAIEFSRNIILVYEKNDGNNKQYFDPTAEVIVELTEEARNMSIDGNVSEEVLREKSGNFFDEALAIRKIEELKPSFSIEYYSCRYTPAGWWDRLNFYKGLLNTAILFNLSKLIFIACEML